MLIITPNASKFFRKAQFRKRVALKRRLLVFAFALLSFPLLAQPELAEQSDQSYNLDPIFLIADIYVTQNNDLIWLTEREAIDQEYLIQQYKWGRWVTVGTVPNQGSMEINQYRFKLLPHKGVNKYRVAMQNHDNTYRSSPTVIFYEETPPVEMKINRRKRVIKFSASTTWWLTDQFANSIAEGEGQEVSLNDLKRGRLYYICFDDHCTKFRF